MRDFKELIGLKKELIDYLNRYEINVVCIPIFKNSKKIIKQCDGVILPGGNEINNDDIKIIKYLYKIDKPTLGICLGMQEMALSLNGQVCKLETNIHNQSSKYVHEIYFNKNSKLFEIIKNDKILVNSRHNYYVIKTNLLITAISNDNIIEALEDPNKKFFIGLQWHPESLKQDLNSQKIFDAFIKIL